MATITSSWRGVRFMIFLAAGLGLRIRAVGSGFNSGSCGGRDGQGIVPIQQWGKTLEQGGHLGVVEQARGDDELAGPGGNEGGIGLEQSLDFRLRLGGAVRISAADCVSTADRDGNGRVRSRFVV